MSKPTFIVGRHRSGTTWLGNILLEHDEIFAPADEVHHGIHESAFFSNVLPYYNYGNTEIGRLALKYAFEESDYYKLLDIPKLSSSRYLQFDSMYEYFAWIMAKAAKQRNAKYWLEKTPAHLLDIDEILKNYEEAYILLVKRDYYDTTSSNVHKFGRKNSLISWIKHAAWTGIYDKYYNKFKDVKNVQDISYEYLLNSNENAVNEICQFLKIEYQNSNSYKKNSSYKGTKKTDKLIYWCITLVVVYIVKAIPFLVIDYMVSHRKKQNMELPAWFYKMVMLEAN